MIPIGKVDPGGADRAPQTDLVGAGVAALAAAVFPILDAIGRLFARFETCDRGRRRSAF